MNLLGVVRELSIALVVGVFLFFFFRKVLRFTRVWALVTALIGSGLLAGAFLATMASRAFGLADYRLVLMVLAMGISVLCYFCLACVVVWAVNGVWWLVTRSSSSPSTSPAFTETERPKRAIIEETDDIKDNVDTVETASHSRISTKVWVLRACTVVGVAFSLLITGYGYVEAQSPQITPVTVDFADLPSNFDGMTIALVTDLHISTMTRSSFLPMVVDQINAAHPDLIVIAGDLVDGCVETLGKRMSVLKDLAAPYGVVVTMGNHETYSGTQQWLTYFDSLGLTVLNNDGIFLTRGTQSITLLGVGDLKAPDNFAPDLQRAVDRTGSCATTFCILAAHEPAQVLADEGLATRVGIDLQLSGHTHGGQLWPLKYLTRLSQPAVDGVHVINHVTVVTSRGVGTFRPPVRVGAAPEIPLITLRNH